MEQLKFEVEGSQGDHYIVTFKMIGSQVRAFCTCLAGANGVYCKHRFALMDGEVSRLLSDNTADLIRLKSLMQGSDLGAAYARVLQASATCAAAKKDLDSAKRELARVMHQ